MIVPRRMKPANHRRKILNTISCVFALLMLLNCILVSCLHPVVASALSDEQKALFQSNVKYFNVAGDCNTSNGTSVDTTSTKSRVAGGFTLEQVKTFSGEPISSTWNISDSTVEQWFLKQAGALSTKNGYGLNSGNIGDITSAVKTAGVSPVFFYAYTVTEGGGAGGFINHFGSSTGGGGKADAKRDAEYLASQSKIMNSKPSWVDAGHPVDFVPQDVKAAGNADFQKLPSGTIGRAYIAATAATTWEVYYPEGLSKQYNTVQDYGKPLSGIMQDIKTMGGDPLQGGATVSTAGCATSGVVGQGMEKAISFAVAVAKNDGYGYDQLTRESGWKKWKSDPSCIDQCGSFDCSSLISAALTEAGYFSTNPNFATGGEGSALTQVGFRKVADSAQTSKDLQPGDILISSTHTEMYIGDGKSVGAHLNEDRGSSGGKVGDQTGKEISVVPFYDDSWTAVYRTSN